MDKIKMNKALFTDVKRILGALEGLPYWEVRVVLLKALEVIERQCFLDVSNFTESKEVEDIG